MWRRSSRTWWTVAALALWGCQLDLSVLNLPPPVVTVRLTPADTSVPIGAQFRIVATTLDERGAPLTGRLVGWSTDAPGVVRVDTSGFVYALATGNAVVTARSEGRTGTASIEVIYEPVASVRILPRTALLAAGQTSQFRADVRDGGGLPPVAPPPLAWRTTDTAIAIVDPTGLVHARAPGMVAVIAEAAGKSDTATVTVVVALASVSVAPGDTVAGYGGRVRYVAVLRDSAGNVVTDRPVSWATSDTAIATISPSGGARLTAPGTVTVTATATGASGSATLQVLPLALRMVVGGWSHSCGLTADSVAFCWGEGDRGALGSGTLDGFAARPVAVATDLRFASITAGANFTCALTGDGAAFCWGLNEWGQLGAATARPCGERCSPTPVAVEGGLLFTSISTGATYSCGLTLGGAAYCWGASPTPGPLARTPRAVAGGVAFASIAAGALHTCGLTAAGVAYCWGDNQQGAVGDGSQYWRDDPGLVLGSITFQAIAAGDGTTCGLTPSGATYCWGMRYGADDPSPVGAPTLVPGITLATIALSGDHFCGVDTVGQGYCWGGNRFGQLGDGSQTPRPAPFALAGATRFTDIRAGGEHTCGLGRDGLVYCWGNNLWGQIGRSGSDLYRTPIVVEGQR